MASFIEALQKHGKKAGLQGIEVAADSATLKGYLPSGNFALNWVMSGKFYGGWPLGHVAEIYGDPSTGKSYLIARAIAEALKGTSGALLDDTEGAFNAAWAAAGLGVDTTRLALAKTHLLSQHHDLVLSYIAAMKEMKITDPSVLALDSLALLTSEEEVKGGMKKAHLKRAGDIKKMFRLFGYALAELPCAYLVTNHAIANIGDPFKPMTTGGGGGLKFQSSIRLELRTPSRLKDVNKRFIGVKISAFVEKNRLVSPWRKCQMIIPFFQGISPVSGLVDLLLSYNALQKTEKKNTLVYNEEDTGVPANVSDTWKQDQSAIDLLAKYPTLLTDLEKRDFYKPADGTPMISPGSEDEEEEEREKE